MRLTQMRQLPQYFDRDRIYFGIMQGSAIPQTEFSEDSNLIMHYYKNMQDKPQVFVFNGLVPGWNGLLMLNQLADGRTLPKYWILCQSVNIAVPPTYPVVDDPTVPSLDGTFDDTFDFTFD